MLALLKWLLVVGTLAALFALVPVGGRTLLERARGLQDLRRARFSQLPEELPAVPPPRPGRTTPPRRPAAPASRVAPLPEERLSPSDHAALDRLVNERSR